ncbi:MAG: site-specific integrase [Propionibacteriaceae bacterium]|nr:site-specific integrase [Propionibacteriaceae bacterium]
MAPRKTSPTNRGQKGRGDGWGQVTQRASGQWAIRYTVDAKRYSGKATYATKGAAKKALAEIHADVVRGVWKSPDEIAAEIAEAEAQRLPTFGEYVESWMAVSRRKPKTDKDYRLMIDKQLTPRFGTLHLDEITPVMVTKWFNGLLADKPTARAKTYSLLSTIFNDAIRASLIQATPCRVRGGGTVRREELAPLPTEVEIALAVEFTPPEHRLLVYLAAGLGLRSGEVRALQRGDINIKDRTLTVRRNIVRLKGGEVQGTPKTAAGNRVVGLPEWMVPLVNAHLAEYVKPASAAWLFTGSTGGWLPNTTLQDVWVTARDYAGIPRVRFHQLRAYAATRMAIAGMSDFEIMAILGQESPGVLRRYLQQIPGRVHKLADMVPSLVG